MFFARGPGIPRGSRVNALTVNDVTPTVLAWLGLPLARDMEGRAASFLGPQPPRPLATYDRCSIERLYSDIEAPEQEKLEILRSLGYIE